MIEFHPVHCRVDAGGGGTQICTAVLPNSAYSRRPLPSRRLRSNRRAGPPGRWTRPQLMLALCRVDNPTTGWELYCESSHHHHHGRGARDHGAGGSA